MTAQGVLAEFGERLRAKRRELKISPDEFAAQIGFNGPEAVLFLESGAMDPTADALIKMAKVYRIDIHELLTGEPGPAAAIELEALQEIKRGFRKTLLVAMEAAEKIKPMGKAVDRINRLIDGAISEHKRKVKNHGQEKGKIEEVKNSG